MKISKISSVFSFVVIGMFFIFSFQANASIVIYGTRIIYPADKKEVSVRTENKGQLPALAQVSIDAGDVTENAEQSNVPFFITPPLTRIEPNAGQVFRLIHTDLSKNTLPKDRESLFYFNLTDIPPMPKAEGLDSGQYVQLSIVSRLKLFYRPTEIVGKPVDAAKSMQWAIDGADLKVSNPSSYYVSLGAVYIKKTDGIYKVDVPMVSPKSEVVLDFNKLGKLTDASKVDFKGEIGAENGVYFEYLNDHGSPVPSKAELIKGN